MKNRKAKEYIISSDEDNDNNLKNNNSKRTTTTLTLKKSKPSSSSSSNNNNNTNHTSNLNTTTNTTITNNNSNNKKRKQQQEEEEDEIIHSDNSKSPTLSSSSFYSKKALQLSSSSSNNNNNNTINNSINNSINNNNNTFEEENNKLLSINNLKNKSTLTTTTTLSSTQLSLHLQSLQSIPLTNHSNNGNINNNTTINNKIINKKINSLNEIPIDYTIKTNIQFLSNQSFSWTLQISSFSKSYGLTSFFTKNNIFNLDNEGNFLKGIFSQQINNNTNNTNNNSNNTNNGNNNNYDLNMCSEFYKNLLYYISPNELLFDLNEKIKILPINDNTIFGYNKYLNNLNENEIKYLNNRLNDWIDSLLSIYNLLIMNKCSYFYLLFNYHLNKGSILFLGKNIFIEKDNSEKNIPIRCILNNPNKEMINKMEEEELEFTLLNNNTINGNLNNNRTDQESYFINEVNNLQQNYLFYGKKQVHSFLNFLIEYHCHFQLNSDVPTILSPTLFLNSILKSLQFIPITKNNILSENNTINGNDTNKKKRKKMDKNEIQYGLEINGYILPHIFNDLCKLLFEKGNDILNVNIKNYLLETNKLNEIQLYQFNNNSQLSSQMSSQQLSSQQYSSQMSFINGNGDNYLWEECEEMKGNYIYGINRKNDYFVLKLKKV
ncbi:hypothetical protein ABK040_010607 [Willaertia magna]